MFRERHHSRIKIEHQYTLIHVAYLEKTFRSSGSDFFFATQCNGILKSDDNKLDDFDAATFGVFFIFIIKRSSMCFYSVLSKYY
jgi:hypothetical protein